MFTSAKLKLERAKKHISDLEAAFDAFVQANRYTFSIGGDAQTQETAVDVNFNQQIPAAISLILADAIHNLRIALDHAVWELVALDRGTQDRWLTLPTGRTQIDYEASCNGIKTPRDDTKKFLISLAAYEGGSGQELYGLHLLDNVEKHSILTPLAAVSRVGFLQFVNPDGTPAATIINCTFRIGPDGRARIARMAPGVSVQLDHNSNPTIDIFFGDVEFFRHRPSVPTLMHLSDAVADTLAEFESFVGTRAH